MNLGKRIEKALNGRPAKILSDSIEGLTQQTVSNLITRDSKTSEFAIRIADRLGVSVRWLIDGVGEPDATDWPFPEIDRARFDALSPTQRGEVQSAVRDRLDALEGRARPAPAAYDHRGRELNPLGMQIARILSDLSDDAEASHVAGWTMAALQFIKKKQPYPPLQAREGSEVKSTSRRSSSPVASPSPRSRP